MANLAQVLKSEIARLARKEVKQEITALRKAATQYRGDIAELKRQVKDQQRRITFLESQETKRVKSPKAPKEAVENARFSPKWLRSHREKLGLSAADYAKLVGVSAQTIYLWEREQTTPRKSQLAALVAVRKLGVREAQRRLELL
ncbi:MAG: helix-turn-helix transcriptional regulator [Phycisphaerales bacterium]